MTAIAIAITLVNAADALIQPYCNSLVCTTSITLQNSMHAFLHVHALSAHKPFFTLVDLADFCCSCYRYLSSSSPQAERSNGSGILKVALPKVVMTLALLMQRHLWDCPSIIEINWVVTPTCNPTPILGGFSQ